MLSAEQDVHQIKWPLFENDIRHGGAMEAGQDNCPGIGLVLSGDGRTLRDESFFCFIFRRTQSNIGFASQQSSKSAFQLPF
jgi:hypothetical protein